MTRAELYKLANEAVKNNPDIRLGQAMWNIASSVDPMFVNTLRGGYKDPFYDNKRISLFLDEVCED